VQNKVPFAQGEQVDASGSPAGINMFRPLASGVGYAVRLAHAPSGANITSTENASAVFNAAGQLTAVTTDFGSSFNLMGGGSHAEFGTDGVLAWGRWIGPVELSTPGALIVNHGPDQGLHYVVGVPSPSMPASGSATYSVLGATSPTYVSGVPGPGKFDGFVTVTFGPSGAIDGNFKVAMPDTIYSWSWRAATAAQFSATVSAVSGCAGGSVCSAYVDGLFSGASAERIGAAYHIGDGNRNVIGAAAFKKQ
jgi:hypothetical protein